LKSIYHFLDQPEHWPTRQDSALGVDSVYQKLPKAQEAFFNISQVAYSMG